MQRVKDIEVDMDAREQENLRLQKGTEAIREAELRAARKTVRRAAFDIGSGATKLEVADVLLQADLHPRAQPAVFAQKVNLLLTEDLESGGRGAFSAAMLGELEAALRTFKAKAVELGAEQLAGVATAAFRKASNGPEFLRRMQKELGIRLRIVTQVKK